MNAFKERIDNVRKIMDREGVDVYMVCTGDYHMSEYAGEYFGAREFLSGFTGSAGTLVISDKEAVLFTDGRYFVQAEIELAGTGIKLMRSGVKGVPTVSAYVADKLPFKGCFGMDGRTVSSTLGEEFNKCLAKKECSVNASFDAVGRIWQNRPEFPMSRAYEIECGESRASKLGRVRDKLAQAECCYHLVASLDDICWLFNIRGNDVHCNPVIMAYALVSQDSAVIYSQQERFDEELMVALAKDGVRIEPYDDVYMACRKLGAAGDAVLVDGKRVNYALMNELSGACVVNKQNPTVLMKAVKNDYEIRQLKSLHIEDGLALTRFICYVKSTVLQDHKGPDECRYAPTLTEASAAACLDELRAGISDFVELSFDTISAYGANAAMMHYHAKEGACEILKPEGMLLVDSGGQYTRGTTDVTRTIALGKVSDSMKRHYTLTLKGMLALADAHFLRGCTGYNLDILARQPLWEDGVDYRCGTGHGIGYMLNVHEAPNGFRWRHFVGKNDLCELEPGMVTSDEPGVYIDGEYGIRIENEILCVKDYENEYGEFLSFQHLTCVPFEPELIDVELLDKKDKERLNNYNEWVYTLLSPHLSGAELEYVKYATKRIE